MFENIEETQEFSNFWLNRLLTLFYQIEISYTSGSILQTYIN